MYSYIKDCLKFFVASAPVSETVSTRATPNYGSTEARTNEQAKFKPINTGELTQQTFPFYHQPLERTRSLPMPIPGTKQNNNAATLFSLHQSHEKTSKETSNDLIEIFQMSQ